jgi:hypothetical protein
MKNIFFNVNFLTQQNIIEQIDAEITVFNEWNEMKKKIQTLHIQRKIWRGHNKKSICWDFYCVNDDKGVDLGSP